MSDNYVDKVSSELLHALWDAGLKNPMPSTLMQLLAKHEFSPPDEPAPTKDMAQ